MHKKVKDYWVEAIKSGNYKPGKLILRSNENAYCFLGILAVLDIIAYNSVLDALSPSTPL